MIVTATRGCNSLAKAADNETVNLMPSSEGVKFRRSSVTPEAEVDKLHPEVRIPNQ